MLIMWGKIKNWFWQEFLGPRNKWRFRRRIALRVRWLYFKRWWRETVSPAGFGRALQRPVPLLLFGLGLPIAIIWFSGWGDKLFDLLNALKADNALGWRAAIQPLLLLIGLPSAFVLWAFRDANASAALENQRKDINLKEFQEIQLRAAGALDEKLPVLARQTLQIAAIHQLRPFLRGEYGESFRLPAWELLKARLATSAAETGTLAITQWVKRGGFPAEEGESAGDQAWRTTNEIRKKLYAITPGPVTQAERALIRKEAGRLLRHGLPLQAGRYDGIDLSRALLARLDMSAASFVGAQLNGAHLENAILYGANLEGANLTWAHLESADLRVAHLEGADLRGAYLRGADLSGVYLRGADLRGAHLEGADLFGAHLEGTDLCEAHLEGADLYAAYLKGADLTAAHLDDRTNLLGAVYDDTTRFARNWDKLTHAARDAARQPWPDRGMFHVSEVKP